MPAIRTNLPAALAHQDIRRACCAVEAIFGSIDVLDALPAPALEAIRDYCSDWNRDRTGPVSEFKAAWISMVVQHLDDERLRERRLFQGITGEDQP